jgi:hypothetical protein
MNSTLVCYHCGPTGRPLAIVRFTVTVGERSEMHLRVLCDLCYEGYRERYGGELPSFEEITNQTRHIWN